MNKANKFNVYFLNDDYYDYLFNQNNLTEMMNDLDRPHISYLGFDINGIDYAIPLTSDSNNKYKPEHKYSIPIYDNSNNKLGVLLINKMIPIVNDNHFIKPIDINKCSRDYINQLLDELNYLNQPEIYNKVHDLASEIYNTRRNMSNEQIKNCKDTNIKFAVDFKQAEELMYGYVSELNLDKANISVAISKNFDIANECFHPIYKYLEKNNIDKDNKIIFGNSSCFNPCKIALIKNANNSLQLIEEGWQNELNENPKVYQNKNFSLLELNNLKQEEFLNKVKNLSGWESVYEFMDKDEVDEYIIEKLDEWKVAFKDIKRTEEKNDTKKYYELDEQDYDPYR